MKTVSPAKDAELTEEKTKGRKRHSVVDVLGCMLSVVVYAANIYGTKDVISTIRRAHEQYTSEVLHRCWISGTFVSDAMEQLGLNVNILEKIKLHQWKTPLAKDG